ncbi:MAG: hypothetical protein HQ445_08140 [Polaromonas sp.]|nr:hypothetical protein [Polaromonas sp.]
MTRFAVIELHESPVSAVHRHSDSASDKDLLTHAMLVIGAHKIKSITICHAVLVFDNTTSLEIAIKTAERLTA